MKDNWSEYSYKNERYLDTFARLLGIDSTGGCIAVLPAYFNEGIGLNILLSTNALGNLSKDGKDTFKVNYKYKNTCFPSVKKNIIELLQGSQDIEQFFNNVIINHKFYSFHLKIIDNQAQYNSYKDYIKILRSFLEASHSDSQVTMENLKLFIRPLQDILKIKQWYQQSEIEDTQFSLIDNTIPNKHAEMNLLENNKEFHGYIGISKLSCLPCKDIVDQKGSVVRGSHTKKPQKWTQPEIDDIASSIEKYNANYQDDVMEHHELSDDDEFEKIEVPLLDNTLSGFKKAMQPMQKPGDNKDSSEEEYKESYLKADLSCHKSKAQKHYSEERIGYDNKNKNNDDDLDKKYMDNNYWKITPSYTIDQLLEENQNDSIQLGLELIGDATI